MILFAIIMFAVAALSFVFGALIFRGRIDLIHDYHTKLISVENRPKYCRTFSAGLFALGAFLSAAGVVSLLDNAKIAVILTVAGIILSLVIISVAQRRYNGGFF